MARPFATVAQVAQARLRHAGRRIGFRATLFALCGLAGLIFLVLAGAAATVALSARVGPVNALAIMAGLALLVALVLLAVLALEARRHRRIAERRAELDRKLYSAAALSAAASSRLRLPSRSVAGLALVALGTVLVLARGGRDED